jgi:hypothetical protein
MREQVLKVAATLAVHARRITVHLGDAADKWWPSLLKGLPRLTALTRRITPPLPADTSATTEADGHDCAAA